MGRFLTVLFANVGSSGRFPTVFTLFQLVDDFVNAFHTHSVNGIAGVNPWGCCSWVSI